MKASTINFLFIFFLIGGGLDCNKAVDPGANPTALSRASVYQNNTTAAAALTGLYSNMVNTPGILTGALSEYGGLSADELSLYSTDVTLSQFYTNSLLSTNASIPTWSEIYKYVYLTNAALEGLSASSTLTPSIKQQLTGEAYFVRGILYFYAVNLFGDVALVTTTNEQANAISARKSKAQVYQQIVQDLTAAQNILSVQYLGADVKTATSERVRPTRWAATALLARTYLFTSDWSNAEAQASKVISNSPTYSLALNPDSVFLKNSNEAIWQLQPVNPTLNTNDGKTFILTTSPVGSSSSPVALSQTLLSIFETGDIRRKKWIKDTVFNAIPYSYPFKYKVKAGTGASVTWTEYTMILRLAEQYLIRAEARAQQGNITGTSGALSDLNAIRNRAGLSPYAGTTDQASVLAAILHERQTELFTELGHRWLDLKRTSSIDAVMGTVTPQKGGGAWNSSKALFPIPNSDILSDPSLTQNPGYN